jgi:hypothetical protein
VHAGRNILQKLDELKKARQSVRDACQDLNNEIMPAMKNFYQPLKKGLKYVCVVCCVGVGVGVCVCVCVCACVCICVYSLTLLLAVCRELERYHSGWKDKFEAEAKERKKLHNLVLELKGILNPKP